MKRLQLRQILTTRHFAKDVPFQIVYEWEDVLSNVLDLPLVVDFKITNKVIRILRRLFTPIARIGKPHDLALGFEMSTCRDPGNNNKHIIPCVIDFFLNDNIQLKSFYKDYSKNPVVLISSREAFEFLKHKECSLPIAHWPLSIPDKWATTEALSSPKRYDVAIVGRPNPMLVGFLNQYQETHPNVGILRRIKHGNVFAYQASNDGKEFPGQTRDDYMAVIRMSKAALYATPGMDNAKAEANGFNQVTPRFLELIASGCHILARYPKNPDTDYFEISKFSPSIDSYAQFERQMDYALSTPIDRALYASYLNGHKTSTRARQLLEILDRA